MNSHPYLKTYMAGVLLPTWMLMVGLAGLVISRTVFESHYPLEPVLVFPMAVVPNLWGLWNVLYVALVLNRRIPLGLWGALLPLFLVFAVSSIVALTVFIFLYTLITPHHEFQLIKENKAAAATAFGGSLIGFALPLHAAISHAVNIVDCTLWGIVALVVQLATFFVIRLFLSDLPERIARNELAAGIFVATTSIAVGLLNAASMTY